MPNFCINPFISQPCLPSDLYIQTAGHIILMRCTSQAINRLPADVPHLYSACAKCHSHVNNSRNVKHRWNNCYDNDRVHTEFRHFLPRNNFGMLARIIIIYLDFLLPPRRVVMSSQITLVQSSRFNPQPIYLTSATMIIQ